MTIESPPVTRREQWCWAGFDFANSSFTTVITTVVYAAWFEGKIIGAGGYLGISGDSWWGLLQALSQVLVLLTAPAIGAAADRGARKKVFLTRAWILCAITTASLSFVPLPWIVPAMVLVVLATMAFSVGENVVAGFLPELAPASQMGRLSALGWSLGYFGGLFSLVLSLALVEVDAVAWVPLMCGAFFFLAGLPTYFGLRERAVPNPDAPRSRGAWRTLVAPFRERHRYPDLFRFLAAILGFQAGVSIVIAFASIYAERIIGLGKSEIIVLFIALQLAAAGGAFLFGRLQDRYGSRSTLAWTLVFWIVAAVLCALSTGRTSFLIAAILAGAVMGATQSGSRALVGVFCPPGREAEWFGLWGFATKGASVIGLLGYSLGRQWFEMRTCILGTAAFFLIGLVLLLRIDVERGIAAARSPTVN